MISTSNIGLSYGGKKLFEDVNIKFTHGNCYGLIGANGAGKSTFLKLLSKEIDSDTGHITVSSGERVSILRQDHFKYNDYSVLHTVLMGNQRLYEIMMEKDAIYAKPDFSEEDGIKASELETEFSEMNGWEAESEAATLLSGLNIGSDLIDKNMSEITGGEKVKVLLAQALFGSPDILLLDEPTNHLDINAIHWLENFLLEFKNTVIVVSHDRHFLNKVCTHIADIDFGKITSYAGNYDFWRRASELAIRLKGNERKKSEEKAKDLKSFIERFSANASKSKQATSRQKQLDKLKIEDLPVSSRKFPYVHFAPEREAGKDILSINGLSKTIDGVKILNNISFTLSKGDKIVLLGKNDLAKSVLLQILMGELEPDEGSFSWGVTTTRSYLPSNFSKEFDSKDSIIDWLREFSTNKDESFLRGFLGRMLFSGDEAKKNVQVLSGGEKMRCLISKLMLSEANVLLLDGPTNHLDLEGITAINEGLIKFPGTLIFTSHDHEFIQTVANRIIHINGTLVDDRKTTYDQYLNLSE